MTVALGRTHRYTAEGIARLARACWPDVTLVEDLMARLHLPHEGYRDGEMPVYVPCVCGQRVRADRLDLLREHFGVCAVALHGPNHEEEAHA